MGTYHCARDVRCPWQPGRIGRMGTRLGLARMLATLGVLGVVVLAPGGLAAQQTGQAHAVRVEQRPRIDGVLDEDFWSGIEPVTGFLQREPVDGSPASEATEVRIAYDENALYFGLTLHDREPGAIRRSILEREGRIDKDDRVVIALDTYHDGRNAYIFELNPFGTQGDALISDESMSLDDWNWEGVYESEGRITPEGWVLEVAIPFTTIRFDDVDAPEMGIAFYRSIRRKNEEVFWPHIGQRYGSGIAQVSRYATLTGLQGLRRGRYLEVKPFAIAGAQKLGGEERSTLGDVGLDLKYALTSNVTLDATWNTDFAQVEADNVQVNLTRFSLFFPEKREFFLERAGLFQFGAARETEVFFSRRIGLESDIQGGARLTGQVGPVSMGVLSLRTDETRFDDDVLVPGAWNSVVRVRADVLPRTTVGAIATSLDRSSSTSRTVGVDASARFWGNSSLELWTADVIADADEGQVRRGTGAGQAELTLRNDRFLTEMTYTRIGEDFDPALGFVPRPDQVRYGGQVGWFPRFEGSTWARRLTAVLGGNRIEDTRGNKESHSRLLHTMLSLQSGDWVMVNARESFERLVVPAAIQGRPLPVGDYTFRSADVGFRTNESRVLSLNGSALAGEFWSGTRTRFGGGLVWKPNEHLTLSPSLDWNDIHLPVDDGDFSTTVFSLDARTAVSRDLFASALVQWDDVSETLQANIRVDWIHTPGSDLFVVLDTGYFTSDLLDPRATRWQRRAGIVKLTWLKAF